LHVCVRYRKQWPVHGEGALSASHLSLKVKVEITIPIFQQGEQGPERVLAQSLTQGP
jgi:hypothetical protein